MKRTLLFVLAASCGLALLPAVSRADDRATAQRLFEEGQTLFKAGNIAEACAKFDGAAAMVNTPGVRLNLARCWEKLGRTASAWTRYDEALAAAERVGDRAAATAARQGRTALEPRLTKLVISFTDPSTSGGVEITRDGETLPASVIGSDLPVDPGEHEVGAHAPGFKPWSTKVTVSGEGTTSRVSIPPLEREPTATPTPPPTTETPAATPATDATSASPPSHALAITGLVTAGVGVVGLGLGTYFGLTAESKWHQANRNGNACADAACPSLTQQASNNASASTVLFITGGVLAAAGVTIWVVAPKGGSSERAALAPIVGPNVAGLGLGGTFR